MLYIPVMPPNRTVFVVVKSFDDLEESPGRAVVGLRWDNWDDYGFKTSFEAQVRFPGQKPTDLGVVKILRADQDGGRTELPKEFVRLSEDFCSLGQSLAYYEILHKLGTWAQTYLHALRDVVVSPIILKSFETHKGFRDSFLRSSGAEIALSDAPNLFLSERSEPQDSETGILTFGLRTTVGGNTFEFAVDLGRHELDERCAVVIGYNASGKTKLLGNIGMIASRKRDDPDALRIRREFGDFLTSPPTLSGVLAFSYSAFDRFEIPRISSEAQIPNDRTAEEAEGQRGYVYCGLRRAGGNGQELKTSEELTAEFLRALERCKSRGLRDRFLRCMAILAEEPSLREYSAISSLMQQGDLGAEDFYTSLSSGHKLIIKVTTQLVAFLQKRSLVLFDEPEMHLHPSLLAALMKSIRYLLRDTSSFAIIATHSPVVIQETPSRNVHVIRRNGRETTVGTVKIETFGENIGILTSEVFDLDASQSDYRHLLEKLSERSLNEIDTLFAKPLGTQARSFVRSIQALKK